MGRVFSTAAAAWFILAAITSAAEPAAKANASGNASGHLTYQDHVEGRTVKSTAVTTVRVVSESCVQIIGSATVNGVPGYGFDVTVCDNDEPGKDSDYFSIVMSDAYMREGTLGGGNVQIHK